MDEELFEHDDHECDNCEGNEEYYEFYQDGHRYHGYECGVCGKLLQTGQENSMNRYMVELKKDLKSKKSFRLYIRAYSIAQVVEMLNDEYFITELELKNE